MSENKTANKIIPGGLGCQGCGCLIIIILIISAFIAGVIFSDDVKNEFEKNKHRISNDVETQIDSLKDKVK